MLEKELKYQHSFGVPTIDLPTSGKHVKITGTALEIKTDDLTPQYYLSLVRYGQYD